MMYLLERMHLVQFYLFSATTLHFGKRTAIVAPNGSGKSAVLDGMQIVLHGGDQRSIDLNAQSGGSKDGRSIREYLLGYYRGDEYVRKNATCYLTMVFRDSDGKLPVVSAGLCLGASIDEPKHRVNGMYILPGVDLSLEDHTQHVDGELVPLPWQEFRALADERAREGGVDEADFTPNRHAFEFVDRLLYRLNGTRRDLKVFTKALKNALNLKDVHDASAFVRERIIEDRPINTAEFRNQLDTFRSLNLKIAEVIERVEAGDSVLESARKAGEARMKRASYKALLDDLLRDEAMDALNDAEVSLEDANATLRKATARQDTAKRAEEAAANRLKQIIDRDRNDPALQALRSQQSERENRLTPIKKMLASELRTVCDAFAAAARIDPDAGAWSYLSRPWSGLLQRVLSTGAGEGLGVDPAAEIAALKAAVEGLRPLIDAVDKRAKTDLENRARSEESLKLTISKLERLRQGRSSVADEVVSVINRLADAGIEAVPVCDQVRITEPEWATVIEAQLGQSASALLVDQDKEDDAIAIYESIPAGFNPHRVRIVQSSRARFDVDAAPSDALARLIVGDNPRAVQFLQSRLGRLVKLNKATRDSRDGLTRSGTIVSNGTIGRLRPLSEDQLLIGKRDTRGQIDRLVRARQEQSDAFNDAERRANRSLALQQEVRPLEALATSISRVEEALGDHAREERLLTDADTLHKIQESPDLVAMQELVRAATHEHNTAKLEVEEANKAVGGAESLVNSSTLAHGKAKAAADAQADVARESWLQPHVDAGWIDARRTAWERQDKTSQEQISTCGSELSKAHEAYGNLESNMRVAVNGYRDRYRVEMDVDPSDPDAVAATMSSELARLRDSELAAYKEQAEDAYRVSVRTFRSRIAASLRDNFDDMRTQIRELNAIMDRMPAFTNDECYHFKWWVNSDSKTLHKFIVDVADRGADDTMFDDPVNTPEEFRALLEDIDSPAQDLLRDYRKFFSFDVEVRHQGKAISTLKSRMEKGSGGEHRAPLFVIAGAALAAAYGKLQGNPDGMSLILFDELGDKIDSTNTKAVFEYLRSLGLQPVVAAPDDALNKINESIDGYIELYREGAYLSVNHVGLGPDADALLQSDSWVAHPELLEQETRRVMEERGQVL